MRVLARVLSARVPGPPRQCLSFNPEGSRLAIGGWDVPTSQDHDKRGKFMIVDLRDAAGGGGGVLNTSICGAEVWALCWSVDGSRVVTASVTARPPPRHNRLP